MRPKTHREKNVEIISIWNSILRVVFGIAAPSAQRVGECLPAGLTARITKSGEGFYLQGRVKLSGLEFSVTGNVTCKSAGQVEAFSAAMLARQDWEAAHPLATVEASLLAEFEAWKAAKGAEAQAAYAAEHAAPVGAGNGKRKP